MDSFGEKVRVLRRKRVTSLMMRLCEAVRRGSTLELTRILSGRRININKASLVSLPLSRSSALHLAHLLRAAQRRLAAHAHTPPLSCRGRRNAG
jgi:hypothetical protein